MEFFNNSRCFGKLKVCIFMSYKKFILLFANDRLRADYQSATSRFDGLLASLSDNLLVDDWKWAVSRSLANKSTNFLYDMKIHTFSFLKHLELLKNSTWARSYHILKNLRIFLLLFYQILKESKLTLDLNMTSTSDPR